MIRYVATLSPVHAPFLDGGRVAGAVSADVIVERRGDAICFGVEPGDRRLTAAMIRTIMQSADQSGAERDATLAWSFSPVMLRVADLTALLHEWDQTGDPPILSIISMTLGTDRHETKGLAGFIGYELAAHVATADTSRDAARNLARLARHALVNGGLDRSTAYEGVEGQQLHLDWSTPDMVTIRL